MRLLTTTLILTIFTAFLHSTKAQEKQIFLNASAISQPEVFYFSSGIWSHEEIETPPATQINFGFQSHIGKSAWVWETQLSYLHIGASQAQPFTNELNQPIYPAAITIEYRTNELGAKAGIGYGFHSSNNRHLTTFILGASGYIPFLSSTRTKIQDNDWEKSPAYTGGNFDKGILYGIYLKPTYQVKIGKTNSPWSLCIFAEANLIWRNLPNYLNPIFMGGGGLGVSYTLR